MPFQYTRWHRSTGEFVMLAIQEPEKRTTAPAAWALWNLGFRPFYLLAGAFAAVAMTIWVARFAGWTGELAYLRDPLWHAHEMIFGFAQAVIIGFLLTAVGNWTNQPMPTGRHLAIIALAWVAARVLVGMSWLTAAAVAETLFTALAAAGIYVPIRAANNRRNLFFVVLLAGIGLANIGFHLAMAGVLAFPARSMLQTGMNIVLLIMVIMGGRVIPMFTANAVQAKPVRKPWLEKLCVGSVIVLIAVDALNMPAFLVGSVAAIAGVAHAARLWLWQPWRTIGKPILWILHAAYAWIPLHLVLRAASAAGLVTPSIATHALTVGAIGGLTLGMMTRTARGHTGRMLQASCTETLCYVLLQVGALVRVFLPAVWPAMMLPAIVISGALWTAAFGLFTIYYWPVLTRARIDGRPG
jgi:uncharacterized protein involved in response to NO